MHRLRLAFALLLVGLTGCLQAGDATNSMNSTNPMAASALRAYASGGSMAAKFVFIQSSSGSFDPAPSGGTAATPGSGLAATRVFNPDGTPLASGGPSATNWPQWISNLEIGVSGANNASAQNPDCARFATATESTSSTCNFGGGPVNCGASSGLFRVSEYDCARNPPVTGNGGPGDGVYIRATFNRNPTVLGTAENIMAVVEYAASSLNPAPSSPTACFQNGVFDPSVPGCADMTWRMYLKHNPAETVSPFLLFVPPTFGYVNTTTQTGGSGVTAKQFYLPLAGDPGLSVFQLSRISALGITPAFTNACDAGNPTAANSPLCVGMVFYSITFFRM